MPFERPALDPARRATGRSSGTTLPAPSFVALLAAGRGAIPVFETLDHVGLLVRLLPEWEHVRARPQRNAYHRFTVDRHSLEAVAECAALLDPNDPLGAGFDGDVARRRRGATCCSSPRCSTTSPRADPATTRSWGSRSRARWRGSHRSRRRPGPTSSRGSSGTTCCWPTPPPDATSATTARSAASRKRSATPSATRCCTRSPSATRAPTGPAAWNSEQGVAGARALRRDGRRVASGGSRRPGHRRRPPRPGRDGGRARPPPSTSTRCRRATRRAFAAPRAGPTPRPVLLAREQAVDWAEPLGDELWRCTIVEPDRTGLLATAAAALALVGFDIEGAVAASHPSGYALEVFTGHDRFGRLASADDRARRHRDHRAPRSTGRSHSTRSCASGRAATDRRRRRVDRDVRVLVDTDASDHATVVEVHAPDDVGLLARVAAVFVDLDLDVDQAIVVDRRRPGGRRLLPRRRDGHALRPPPRGRGTPGDVAEPPHRGRDARRAPRSGRLVSRP